MSNINGSRIVVLIDMDCFFCQVETRLQPEYEGKPLAVVQYNQWQLGGIIAVNYEARAYGVTRHMRGKEAKEKCPNIILVSVPCLREKSDTSRYRSAGREVIDVISKHCTIIERASVDEAYMDITDIVNRRMTTQTIQPDRLASGLSNTFVVGYTDSKENVEENRKAGIDSWIYNIFEELEDVHSQKLAVAGLIVEEIRADIFNTTKFRCSAGISQNKILAKLACGLHKPNQQTILPPAAVSTLYSTLPVKKVRNLGGKFGDIIVESLGCNVMGDLLQYSLQYLQKRFDEKTGLWLYNIARGVDNEPVSTRLVSKSIGACKKFPGKQAIVTLNVLKHWAGELAAEVCERLDQDLQENQRRATLLTICYHYYQNGNTISQSRSVALKTYKPEVVAAQCVDIITKSTQCPIAYLGISTGKFVNAKNGSITNFFRMHETKDQIESKGLIHKKLIHNTPSTENMYSTVSSETNAGELLQKVDSTSFYTENVLPDAKAKDNLINTVTTLNKNTKTSKKLENDFVTSTAESLEDSPVSRKVSKLIQICNERSKMNSKTTSLNNLHINNEMTKTEPVTNSIKIEDNCDGLKQSFFLSIFQNNKNNHSEILTANEGTEVLDSVKYLNEDKEHQEKLLKISGRKAGISRKLGCSSQQGLKHAFNDNENNSVEDHEIVINVHASNISENTEQIVDEKLHYLRQEEEEDKSKEVRLDQNSRYKNEDCVPSTSSTSVVKLEEIFPDMNNIDVNIIPLLPPDLQEEAYMRLNKYSNNCKNFDSTREKTLAINHSVKQIKSKSCKPKSNCVKNDKNSPLYGFLIKGNTNSEVKPLLKFCTQCGQMIPVEKYVEHKDFHIAQNLQEEINKPRISEEHTKRKSNSSPPENTVKRRANANVNKQKKNGQSIMTFFS